MRVHSIELPTVQLGWVWNFYFYFFDTNKRNSLLQRENNIQTHPAMSGDTGGHLDLTNGAKSRTTMMPTRLNTIPFGKQIFLHERDVKLAMSWVTFSVLSLCFWVSVWVLDQAGIGISSSNNFTVRFCCTHQYWYSADGRVMVPCSLFPGTMLSGSSCAPSDTNHWASLLLIPFQAFPVHSTRTLWLLHMATLLLPNSATYIKCIISASTF